MQGARATLQIPASGGAGIPDAETFTIEGTLYVPDGKYVVETVRKEGKEAQGS